MTLSELLERQSEIEMALIDNGGELTPEIEDALGLNEGDLMEKIDGYHAIISKLEYGNAEIDKEMKRLQEQKKVKTNAAARLKAHLLDRMKEYGIDRINGTLCKVFRKSTPAAVKIEDAVGLLAPYEFDLSSAREDKKWPDWVKVTVEVDKTKLKAALADGEVAGCSLEKGECVVFK